MTDPRTVLLDLDGTLVDSAPLIVHHLAAALAAVGAPAIPHDRLRTLVGPPFELALPELGLSAEQSAATITAYRASYDRAAPSQTPLYPGVPELLARLREAGLRLAVATAKPEATARDIVAGIGIDEHFVLVGGADHDIGRVGKAAVITSVLQRLGLDPHREPVLMVGDRDHDLHGAAANGIPAIGVGWGYAGPGELDAARLLVSDLDELATALLDDAVWAPVGAQESAGSTQP